MSKYFAKTCVSLLSAIRGTHSGSWWTMDVFLGLIATLLATFGALFLVAARIGVVGRAPFAEVALGSVAAVLAGLVLACAIDSNGGYRFGDTRIQISD